MDGFSAHKPKPLDWGIHRQELNFLNSDGNDIEFGQSESGCTFDKRELKCPMHQIERAFLLKPVFVHRNDLTRDDWFAVSVLRLIFLFFITRMTERVT